MFVRFNCSTPLIKFILLLAGQSYHRYRHPIIEVKAIFSRSSCCVNVCQVFRFLSISRSKKAAQKVARRRGCSLSWGLDKLVIRSWQLKTQIRHHEDFSLLHYTVVLSNTSFSNTTTTIHYKQAISTSTIKLFQMQSLKELIFLSFTLGDTRRHQQ